ncbi:terminase large subunit [Pediococcus ethanolidurans]|uniref:terminase large subunit n=1 Tax=Pediococcus ethanolidurans TaxID=319653 RepID=UPI001C1EF9FC|nr:terminase large subunit [Pediococcus ethanolidurans]
MDRTKEYCNKILSGDILAGNKVKQACRRHLNDLKRQRTKDFPYYFDNDIAEKAINFVGMLPTTDGKKLHLELFQRFVIGSLYGWREIETGYRRFNRAFISIAKKNGKSFLISAIGAVALLMESVPARGRQILFTANSSKQSHLAFDQLQNGLKQVASKSPYMRRRLKILNSEIDDLDSDSKAIPLATDTSSLDGYNPTLGIIDEYHKAKTRAVYDVLKSGTIQQPNSLIAVISTSGLELNSPMHEDYEYLSKVLAGKEKSERYFALIYELDEDKEVFDQANWIKANPLMSNKVIAKTMTEQIQSDLDIAIKQNSLNSLLTKNFNVWKQASENSYIASDDWQAGEIENKPDLNNRDVYIGVDLSKSSDLTAVSWLVPIGNSKFYVDSHAFVATKYGLDQKIKTDGIDYRSLEGLGECDITKLDSGVIDYDQVFNYIRELVGRYNWTVKGICFDPWSFDYLLAKFENVGYPLVEVRQYQKLLGIPTKRFKEELFKGNIVHTENKLLAYNVNNAILKYDSNNNPMIDKARHANRIDEIASLINAYVVGYEYYDKQEGEKADNEYYENYSFNL